MNTISLLGAHGMVGRTFRRVAAEHASTILSPIGAQTIIDVCGPGDPRKFTSLTDVGKALHRWSTTMDHALAQAKGSPHVIHLSTMDLDFPPDEPQLYLVYKTLQRDFLRVYMELRGISLDIVETSCIYGFDISKSRYISRAVDAAKTGEVIRVFCKNNQPSERPWTSVTHLSRALLNLAFDKPSPGAERVFSYYSFMANAEWVANKIINTIDSTSPIELDNFYDRPESASHIFRVYPTSAKPLPSYPEDEAIYEFAATIRFLQGESL
jgi:nucleoside-diphosphate-sugar epimerase